jgi:serine protease AprX
MKRGMQLGSVAFFLMLLVAVVSEPAFSRQTQRYWINLRDRGPHAGLSKLSALALGISDHTLWRRAKVLPADRLIDELDLPINQAYVDQLKASGITIRSTSRWLNAVSAELTPTQQATVSSLPFVASVGPVAVFVRHEPQVSISPTPQSWSTQATTVDLNYGISWLQLTTINVVAVHSLGINGAGVVVGMLDDGFNNRKTHPAFKSIKVIAEYDFVQRDSNTSVAPGEDAGQGGHGEGTLSAIGGFDSGTLIGAAYGASFILGKTEIDSIEVVQEEDLWIEGLEWEERLGAEIVSSSLGYHTWYQYSDLNGHTAIAAKGARVAARKGVLVASAMGNGGHSQPGVGTMWVPADADSIVSVGAAASNGIIADFSSIGPTFDGRIKPEIVAQGMYVYTARGTGYQYSFGTSYSTPLTAGVAALVLSANPTLTPMQVRDRLMQTARPLYDSTSGMMTHPNNYFGWGMVDAMKAVQGTTFTGNNGDIATAFVLQQNFPNPFNPSTTIRYELTKSVNVTMKIFNTLGQEIAVLVNKRQETGPYQVLWNANVPSGIYFYRLQAGEFVETKKMTLLR